MKRNEYLIGFISGFLGALCFTLLTPYLNFSLFDKSSAKTDSVISANRIDLLDSKGKLKAQLGIGNEGSPAMWFFDSNGKSRLNLGVYGDGSAFIGLQDKNEQMLQLMRSFGPNEAPLHIFKMKGQDQMIMGLNPAGNSTESFLMYYDSSRKRVLNFGKYEGP